ncbi:formate dehydrogenase subunit delta [Mesorhizobium robiniae]|uniref:Formate dehydrogenase subunit delta n=2 Tax=Mesorhizobium robiniae TaxID=559315 RepID=A0ABV2GJK4_9HYPH
MANQIADFFHSKPRDEGIAGVAEHINKFWEPRMRRQLFEMLDGGSEGFNELVVAASAKIKRPKTPEQSDMSIGYTGRGTAQAESAAPQK